MIELKFHYDMDASTLAVQTSAAKALLDEIRQDEMAGWLTLPTDYDQEEFARIKAAAEKIRRDSKYLVCIGIGGSYLGHKAIIEALGDKSSTKILYAGNSISTNSIQRVLDEIGNDDFSINVISKSGTTTEPAIAFRIFKEKLFEKYGESEAFSRIYATTDGVKGALHDEALANHYERFVVPDNIGGRYSVLTAVGLLPLAAAGINIDSLMAGAREISAALDAEPGDEIGSIADHIYSYAAARHIFRDRGLDTEVLATFEPSMQYFAEWWKQLFGESEGKGGEGIFPASVVYTTDLHSLGQFMQDGRPNMFETIISFRNPVGAPKIEVPDTGDDIDGLAYLAGKDLDYINNQAKHATINAHVQHLPVLELIADDLDENSLGELVYFFELACALSAKLQGVNPFDQPGVEAYKTEMFKLLGKPGF